MILENIEFFLAVSSTIFDMLITQMYFNVCYGKASVRTNKPLYHTVFVFGYAVGMALSQFGQLEYFYMFMTIGLSFALSYLYKAKFSKRIITSLSYTLLCSISELIGYAIVSYTVLSTENISVNELSNLSLLISKIVLFFSIICLRPLISKDNSKMTATEIISLLTIPIISISLIILVSKNRSYFEDLYLVSGALVLINIVSYFLLEKAIESAGERERQKIMEKQLIYQEKKYEQVSRNFKTLNSIIHDTNKHFIYIAECAAKGDVKEIRNYAMKASHTIDSSYRRINTGFLPVDALLSNAIDEGAQVGIDIRTDIRINSDMISIPNYDLCVVLGNLLDNAVEACEKVTDTENRKISVIIATEEGKLLINVNNTAERKMNDELKSDKGDNINHGYGLNNVKDIAEKYYGVFRIQRQEYSCEATFIVPLEKI